MNCFDCLHEICMLYNVFGGVLSKDIVPKSGSCGVSVAVWARILQEQSKWHWLVLGGEGAEIQMSHDQLQKKLVYFETQKMIVVDFVS